MKTCSPIRFSNFIDIIKFKQAKTLNISVYKNVRTYKHDVLHDFKR